MTFTTASVDSFVINFSNIISEDISNKITFYFEILQKLDYIKDIVPSYTSILITYDIFSIDIDEVKNKIQDIKYTSNQITKVQKAIEIPVYYGKEVALDLQMMSDLKNISVEEIISIHTQKIYNVYAIGFAPGYAYLGEVDKRIAMSRLDSPRKKVLKGSVAIADTQTAIYPLDSPGGWNIIGQSTFDMFDKSLKNLCPVSIGDKIQFKQISKNTYIELGGIL